MSGAPASELPRVLNVQQFAAAREPELRGLCEALRSLGRLDGSKLLPRQLRRRATSHRRYVTKRRPNNKFLPNQLQQQQQQQQELREQQTQQHAQQDGMLPATAATAATAAADDNADTEMLDADYGTPAAAAAVCRPLNRRQRRRAALLQLQLAQGSCCQDLAAAAAADSAAADSTAADSTAAAAAAGGGGGSSSGSPRRLETHIWHARRMQMCDRYGHILAAGAVGRGRGSRSFLHSAISNAPQPKPRSRYYKTPDNAAAAAASSSSMGSTAAAAVTHKPVKAVCHDASYWCCLQLQGQQQQLLALLMHLTGAADLGQMASHNPAVTLGQCEFELVIYEPGKFPRGVIGPVKIMWHWRQQQQQQRGLKQQQQQRGLKQQQQQQQQGPEQQQQPSRRASKRQHQDHQRQQQRRTLWMWCHAEYFKQTHDVIQQLVTSHDNTTATAAAASSSSVHATSSSSSKPSVSLHGIQVTSLCSNLRRIEVVGPDADYVIRSVFQQQQQQPGGSATLASSSSGVKQLRKPQINQVWQDLNQVPCGSWRYFPNGCVLGFQAVDPRLAKPPRVSGTAAAAAAAAAAGSSSASKSLRNLIGGWPKNGRLWVSAAKPLLLNPTKLAAAAPEVLVSLWRQQQQQAALGLRPGWQQQQHSGSSSSSSTVVCDLSGVKLSPYGITSYITAASSSSSNGSSSSSSTATGQGQPSSSATTAEVPLTCPVLLIRSDLSAGLNVVDNAHSSTAAAAAAGSSPAWSVILPAGWVMPFWMALIHSGAKPAGLREWSWLAAATRSLLPPLDYPDSAAAVAAAWQQQRDVAAAAAKRPLGRFNMQDHWLPFLDWSRIGQKLLIDTNAQTAAAAGSSGTGSSSSSSVPTVAVCWAAAKKLHAAAVAAKQRQRKQRMQLRRAEMRKKQQQQRQQQQQQQRQCIRPIIVTAIEQPEPFQLLPEGWYVARSWKVLLSALSTAAAAAGGDDNSAHTAPLPPPAAAAAAAVRVPSSSVLASGQCRHTAAARAVKQGLLVWAPKNGTLPPPPVTTIAAAAAAATAATGAGASSSTSQKAATTANADPAPPPVAAAAAAAAGDQDQDHKSDQNHDRGDHEDHEDHEDPEDTDEMDLDDHDEPPRTGVSDDVRIYLERITQKIWLKEQIKLQQQQQPPDPCLVRVSVRVIGKGRCQQGALLLRQELPCSSSSSGGRRRTTGGSSSTSSSLVTLLGYVTTAIPRGAPAGLYPGGLGFCSARCLWGLRSADVSSSSSRVLRAWCLNPGSNVLRRVELTVLLDNNN